MKSADHSPIWRYAAEVAPLIDRVHAGFHQQAAAVFRQRGLERPPHAGILITLRFALADPDRTLPMPVVKLAFRYLAPEDIATALAELADADWLHIDGDLIRPTQRTVSWTNALYDVHAAVAASSWEPAATDFVAPSELTAPSGLTAPTDQAASAAPSGQAASTGRAAPARQSGSAAPSGLTAPTEHAAASAPSGRAASAGVTAPAGLPGLAALVGRVLTAAAETAGPAFAGLYPPHERAGDPPGVVLFNRLAVLRYHRADAHAAAWAAEGLTAQEMQALQPGELRERIEAETNRLAATPYAVLSEPERQALVAGLRMLPAAS